MDAAEREARLTLAQQLRESADHSSEQALRDSLSRSYYSIFHVGCALLGKGFGDHKQFLRDLKSKVGDALGRKVEELQNLRIQADYEFDAVRNRYGGEFAEFRRKARDVLKLGEEAYLELRSLLDEESRHEGNG